jgi:hypothetical protein
MHRPHEFVCADCKSNVFSYGGPVRRPTRCRLTRDRGAISCYLCALSRRRSSDTQTRCANCEVVAEMREERGLTPEDEADLRKLLGCEIPKEEA